MSKITIDTDDLVGIREMAERLVAMGRYTELDAARSAITTWISRRTDTVNGAGKRTRTGNRFPLPLRELKATGVYDWNEVRTWIEEYYAPADAAHEAAVAKAALYPDRKAAGRGATEPVPVI